MRYFADAGRRLAANLSKFATFVNLFESPLNHYCKPTCSPRGDWAIYLARLALYRPCVLHSLVQATDSLVTMRYAVFALASLVLMAFCAVTIPEALGS